MRYSFIDEGLTDFLRYKNGDVIIIFADTFEDAESWLLDNGIKYGWTNTGIKYHIWD